MKIMHNYKENAKTKLKYEFGVIIMSAVLWIMIGGTIGFFTASLCKVAGRADSLIEKMEIDFYPNMLTEASKEISPETPKKPDE
jgi:hypothetical protein